MSELHTARLLLRMIDINDVDDIFEYARTPHVGPNAGWKPHENKEETLEIMNLLFIGKDTIWGIVLKDTGKLIGSIGLIQDRKRENERVKMLGYAIGEKYWGRKIMTEAVNEVIRYGFEDLHLDLISAYCYPFNTRSKSVLAKCRFSYEGTLKKAEQIYNGNIYDNECYALTSEEYYMKRT
jgi:RimJ/RimL family protein N-acetyltransferase